MLIRDHYVNAIYRMASRFGRESGDHVIPRNATLPRCIDYAVSYFHEGDTQEHYRYDRYVLALEDLLQYYGDHRKTPAVVHVDIGCGPGLFSWVVHDFFKYQEQGTELKLHAYDKSPNMVRLAGVMWREFKTDVCLLATSDLEELISQVMQSGLPADVIVSFGHVLAQTSDRDDAIDSFAEILAAIRPKSNLIVAVDAQNRPAVRRFHRAVDGLRRRLIARGLEVLSERPRRGSFVAVVT